MTSSTTKAAGSPCPKCYELHPAEYQQAGQPARWTCHACSATGELSGPLSICRPLPPPPAAPPKAPPPWARNLTVGA